MSRSPSQLQQQGAALANRGDYTGARRVLATAAARAVTADDRARIAGTLAYVLARTGSIGAAEETCHDALALDGLTAETRAIVLGQLGAIAQIAGRHDDAETWLSRAIATTTEDSLVGARMRINRSVIRMQRRSLEEAADDTDIAIAAFRRAGESVEEAQVTHNRGYVNLLRGDLVGALADMARARQVLAEVSPVAAAVSDVDRAEVLRDAGLTTEAERILARTAAVFGTHRLRQDRAEAELNLARSQLTHDPVRAKASAASAARRFRALGNAMWASRAEAVRLRAALSGGRVAPGDERTPDPARVPSVARVESVASELDVLGHRSEAAGLRLSAALWRARHGIVDSARVWVPPSASMDVRLLAHEVRAARASARGRASEARAHTAAGLDALGRWQRDFGSLDLQTSIAMHGTGLMFTGLTSAVRSGRPDVVFEWSERARHLSIEVVPLRPPPDPSLAAELAELRMLRADGADWQASPRAAELQEHARERQWSGTGSAAIEERVGLEALRGELDDDTAYLGYVYSEEGLAALVVTRHATRLQRLDGWPAARHAMAGLRADLDMAASLRAGPLASVIRASLDDRLAALSAALLDGPARTAGTRRLLITAPGILAGIPWAMLPGMRGRAFTLAGSASRWVRRHDGVAAPASAGFAVGPRVARGQEEAETAAAHWRQPSILGRAAVDDVAALAGRVDVLHIAAHGRHAVDNPMFSGLELSDGALFGYDIDRMPRIPPTVVLSACEAGRSSVRWGEEAIGMTRIWLHAGTLCVIAAPVVVADDDACELLAAMHRGLASGAAPAEALRDASDRTGIVAPFQAHGAGF